MYFHAAASFVAAARHMPVNEASSGIAGSISMTAWICVLLPQLIANYKAQSADGLSMSFLVVWLLGDATNLIGALFTNLAPTAIALAIYFCFIDFILISQAFYYNTINARRAARHAAAGPAEDSPLLGRRTSLTDPSSAQGHQHANGADPSGKTSTAEDEALTSGTFFTDMLSLVAVCVVGFAGWFVSYKAGAWDGDEPELLPPPGEAKKPIEIAGLVLGYISAVLYLCARIPQIIKNHKAKSCEGLAVLFFLLSILGNLTYGISLVAYSQDKDYLLNAIPWLIGSLGTIIEDTIIFMQFRMYAGNARVTASDA